MNNDRYNVLWTTYARVALARMGKFKVNPTNVFKRSIDILTDVPKYKADGVSDFANTGMSHYVFWGIDPDEE